MNKDYKEVSKEEFESFIKKYPTDLDCLSTHIREPPLTIYFKSSQAENWLMNHVAVIENDNKKKYYIIKQEILDKINGNN